jgi:hypothetical protein
VGALAFVEWLSADGESIDEQFHHYRTLGCMELIDLYYDEIGIYRD